MALEEVHSICWYIWLWKQDHSNIHIALLKNSGFQIAKPNRPTCVILWFPHIVFLCYLTPHFLAKFDSCLWEAKNRFPSVLLYSLCHPQFVTFAWSETNVSPPMQSYPARLPMGTNKWRKSLHTIRLRRCGCVSAVTQKVNCLKLMGGSH